jgi:hypothetical protein
MRYTCMQKKNSTVPIVISWTCPHCGTENPKHFGPPEAEYCQKCDEPRL